MMVEPLSKDDLEELLRDLRKPEEGIPDLLLAFLEKPVGRNDESGYRKWCRACNDFTGHLIIPAKAWQVEQCRRCGLIERFRCLYPMGADNRRPILVRPGLMARDVLMHMLNVYGYEHVSWCLDRYIEGKAKEAMKAELARRMKEKRALARIGSL